ncbi:MAG TPA: tetratricopeptide repeat protein [Pyrinomonadaceae bacterium]
MARHAHPSSRLVVLLVVVVVSLVDAATHARAFSSDSGAASSVSQNKSQQRKAGGLDKKADELVAEGIAALEGGDEARAADAFRRAVEIEPREFTAHTYLGLLADKAGNLREAERHFAAAAIAAPTSPVARNNHGAILLRLGRTEQAAAQFEVSLRLDRAQPSALVNLAQIRFASNTPEGLQKARELFERAHAIAPDADIARSLVVVALRLNDRTAAAQYYKDYAERLARATATAAAPAQRAELGAALLEAGFTNEALEELNAAHKADPSNVDATVLLARALLARNDIAAAGRTLEAAVASGIDSAPVYAALAEVYQQGGYFENAIPAMRLAIERDPKSEAYRFRYGMLLTDTKAPAAAAIRLQEALAEFPRSARLWLALGIAHVSQDKFEEAAKDFARAIELDPRLVAAHAYLGMTHTQAGRYTEAATHYGRALAIDERLAAAQYLLADVLLKQTPPDTPRAEKHLARAVALDASFVPARVLIGKLYFRQARFDEAAAHLERAVALDPKLAEAHYQLGQVYKRLKRNAEAEAAFATFKGLSENERDKTRDELREITRRLANVRF